MVRVGVDNFSPGTVEVRAFDSEVDAFTAVAPVETFCGLVDCDAGRHEDVLRYDYFMFSTVEVGAFNCCTGAVRICPVQFPERRK